MFGQSCTTEERTNHKYDKKNRVNIMHLSILKVVLSQKEEEREDKGECKRQDY